MDNAASNTPLGISLRALSVNLPTNGMAAMDRGTIAAVVPIAFPNRNRVKGKRIIISITKGTDLKMFTIQDKVAFNIPFSKTCSLSVTNNRIPNGIPKNAAIATEKNTIYKDSHVENSSNFRMSDIFNHLYF
jgi:hypothetical protein